MDNLLYHRVLNKPAVIIMQLHQFALKVTEAANKLETMETTMGDVPEEFLDPLLGTVMNDPVILPNSQITLDRTTLVRHLLRYLHFSIVIVNIYCVVLIVMLLIHLHVSR